MKIIANYAQNVCLTGPMRLYINWSPSEKTCGILASECSRVNSCNNDILFLLIKPSKVPFTSSTDDKS